MRPIESYAHRGGSESLLGETIPERLAQVVEQHPDEEAIVSMHQARRLTYAELDERTDELARGLVALGFRRGDRVGVWATNQIEWLLLQLATARIGVLLVTINPAYRKRELAHALRRSAVQGVFTMLRFRSSDYASMLLELIPELAERTPGALRSDAFPQLRWIVAFDPAAPNDTTRPAPGFATWSEVLHAGEDVAHARLERLGATLDRDDAINIQYTSGTTGMPKAVVLTHHNILNNAYFAARAMGLDVGDRLCVPVPFYHCFGMVLGNLLCLSVGAAIVLPSEHFDAESTLEAIERERCTALHGVPTMFIAELEAARRAPRDLSSLRTGIMAGAPCPPSLTTRVMDELRCPEIVIGYGETEASPLTHLTSKDDDLGKRTTTVGRNLPHQEVKIVDVHSRATVALGEVGEICFRGYHVMRGYYGQPEKTRAVIDDAGWLASGDLGTMDEQGYVSVTGRLKEMIIRGGENIYPREIEDLLYTHPKIAEVAVIGVAHPRLGEEVAACVQLREGLTATPDEIRDFCRGEIAHFKIPTQFFFMDELPKTVTGKIQKFRLRELTVLRRATSQKEVDV